MKVNITVENDSREVTVWIEDKPQEKRLLNVGSIEDVATSELRLALIDEEKQNRTLGLLADASAAAFTAVHGSGVES